MSAISVVVFVIAVELWLFRKFIHRTSDVVPLLSLPFAVVSLVWMIHDHVRRHELIELQLTKTQSDITQYEAWKSCTDLEKYSNVRKIFLDYMLTFLNRQLRRQSIGEIKQLIDFVNVDGVDSVISVMQLQNQDQIFRLYDSFLKIISTLDSKKIIISEVLPFDEIFVIYSFILERWTVQMYGDVSLSS